ncbi:MAG: hypothetical protein V1914_04475 [archaeon]
MKHFDNIKEEDIPEIREKGLLNKFLVMFMGLFMIFLFLSYFLVGPSTMSIIAGMFGSDILNEEQLVVVKGNLTISFSEGVYSELKQLYLDNPRHEFKVCLHGTKDGTTYAITEVIIPETFEQEFNYVVARPCPPNALIDFHSHPEKHCTPSYHDVQLLKRLKENNPDLIMAVMCTLDRFTFYS